MEVRQYGEGKLTLARMERSILRLKMRFPEKQLIEPI